MWGDLCVCGLVDFIHLNEKIVVFAIEKHLLPW